MPGHNSLREHVNNEGDVDKPRPEFHIEVAAARANLGNVGLHTLRHSAATVMIENGVPLKVVSEILGHFTVSITGDIYAHVSPDVSSQAMEALGTALSG